MTTATHARLSESSVSDYLSPPIGKGREGNRKGKGGEARVETPTQPSLSDASTARHGWVVNPR